MVIKPASMDDALDGNFAQNEAIDLREQAMRIGIVVEYLPTMELRRVDAGRDVQQKLMQHQQQNDPQQPCLHNANQSAEQLIGEANKRADDGRILHHAVNDGGDDM